VSERLLLPAFADFLDQQASSNVAGS